MNGWVQIPCPLPIFAKLQIWTVSGQCKLIGSNSGMFKMPVYIYMYIYIYVRVHACACVRACARVYVVVCVCVCVCLLITFLQRMNQIYRSLTQPSSCLKWHIRFPQERATAVGLLPVCCLSAACLLPVCCLSAAKRAPLLSVCCLSGDGFSGQSACLHLFLHGSSPGLLGTTSFPLPILCPA